MYYGCSYPQGKPEIKSFLKSKLHPNDKILDMGAGGGTYWFLLGPDYDWTAVEVWHGTAEYLKDKYNTVCEQDIRDFNYTQDYDLVIFGDVLEHMTTEDAQKVLEKAKEHAKYIMVAIPYNLKQEPLFGNEAERHIQYDLTFDKFNQFYPGFKSVYQVPNKYGYFFWAKEE